MTASSLAGDATLDDGSPPPEASKISRKLLFRNGVSGAEEEEVVEVEEIGLLEAPAAFSCLLIVAESKSIK